ncbi:MULTISPECIES: DUF418 domain-containing protein [Brevibacillus]|jgi:uncharacterized protein|uniref:DUF418 domain-containing protein n=1 Tax=Brevibacillus borstelensis AK1 TaxID=1300222 RepID=M8DGR4_9BACL|nr:DUF418 domain-containing protein [Brevibacillus borstelensis]EMT52627.1 hypothetical protein I532_13259 [Brevibacillus borstelensis AK1]KKX55093.1 membrane protein [Brevibacillus borstelensis cifa_chp40]MCC0563810.1 DUF418 domain-containing protein [Brevibacillus borstelensis]MCM3472071.1 DUF418 domain-containing protein [Brevibacillus borstelensis]MCM3560125.1 DUF418 domain-containing protein [Brevibacillus borstelensis]
MEQRKERIRLLDILRGFAILGTLGTNIWIFAHLGDLTYLTTYDYSGWWAKDDLIRMIVLFLVNGKLLGLLTIMFGVGLELKYQQAIRKGNAWPGIYIWVSSLLFLEGLLHFTLVMEYDILMSYGITAMIVAYIVKGGDRLISITMKVLGSLHATAILGILVISLIDANMTLRGSDEVIALYRDGSWLQQVHYRLSHFVPLRLEAIFTIPMNVFLFLLGVRFMRAGVFSQDENGKKQRDKLFKLGMFIGLPLNLLIFIPGGVFDLPVRYLFAPLLSVGYLAIIGRMIQYTKLNWLWGLLENAGKMSLSCYVMQNIICSILFYGWGFALGGKLDSVTIIVVWIGISVFQILFATAWLQGFRFGPMETLRRRAIGIFDTR